MPIPAMLAVWMKVAPAMDEEFNAWYNDEHVPQRIALPGFLTARRYEVDAKRGDGAVKQYMAHYDLPDLSVLHTEPYAGVSANPTPWTRRITTKLDENIRNEYELVQSIGEAPSDPAPAALF